MEAIPRMKDPNYNNKTNFTEKILTSLIIVPHHLNTKPARNGAVGDQAAPVPHIIILKMADNGEYYWKMPHFSLGWVTLGT